MKDNEYEKKNTLKETKNWNNSEIVSESTEKTKFDADVEFAELKELSEEEKKIVGGTNTINCSYLFTSTTADQYCFRVAGLKAPKGKFVVYPSGVADTAYCGPTTGMQLMLKKNVKRPTKVIMKFQYVNVYDEVKNQVVVVVFKNK